MLTYNTIYSYSTIFYTLLPYTRIVYYSLAILLYTSILGSIWKEKKISILDFFCKEKNPKKRKKNKVQNYCLQANIEKQEKDIISFKNFLFFSSMKENSK